MHLSECVIWFVCVYVGAYTYCIHLLKCVSTHIVGKALEFTFQLNTHELKALQANRQRNGFMSPFAHMHTYSKAAVY